MQVKWGICAAGKTSNDFCVALTTLPVEQHKIQGRVKFSLLKLSFQTKPWMSYWRKKTGFCWEVCSEIRHSKCLRGLRWSSRWFQVSDKLLKSKNSRPVLILCKSIDVVYIGSINSAHYELCKKFLAAGKPVVCEKTFCLNDKQTAEIYEIAKKANLFCMEGLWSRFMPG